MSDVRLIIKVCYEPHRRGDITVALSILEFMDYKHENNTRYSRFMDHIQDIKRYRKDARHQQRNIRGLNSMNCLISCLNLMQATTDLFHVLI
jgi:hypothetical protein